jgi:hypothetical protein
VSTATGAWRARPGDAGQALLLALFFLLFFGVLGAALLSFTSSSWISSAAVANQRSATYGADSAVFGAIQRIRVSSSLCLSGGTNSSDANMFDFAAGGSTISVGCQYLSTSAGNVTVQFTTSGGPGPSVTAQVVFFNSQLSTYSTPGPYAPGSGLQAIQITSWLATG